MWKKLLVVACVLAVLAVAMGYYVWLTTAPQRALGQATDALYKRNDTDVAAAKLCSVLQMDRVPENTVKVARDLVNFAVRKGKPRVAEKVEAAVRKAALAGRIDNPYAAKSNDLMFRATDAEILQACQHTVTQEGASIKPGVLVISGTLEVTNTTGLEKTVDLSRIDCHSAKETSLCTLLSKSGDVVSAASFTVPAHGWISCRFTSVVMGPPGNLYLSLNGNRCVNVSDSLSGPRCLEVEVLSGPKVQHAVRSVGSVKIDTAEFRVAITNYGPARWTFDAGEVINCEDSQGNGYVFACDPNGCPAIDIRPYSTKTQTLQFASLSAQNGAFLEIRSPITGEPVQSEN